LSWGFARGYRWSDAKSLVVAMGGLGGGGEFGQDAFGGVERSANGFGSCGVDGACRLGFGDSLRSANGLVSCAATFAFGRACAEAAAGGSATSGRPRRWLREGTMTRRPHSQLTVAPAAPSSTVKRRPHSQSSRCAMCLDALSPNDSVQPGALGPPRGSPP